MTNRFLIIGMEEKARCQLCGKKVQVLKDGKSLRRHICRNGRMSRGVMATEPVYTAPSVLNHQNNSDYALGHARS